MDEPIIRRNMASDIGVRLKHARTLRGLSQGALAKAAGVKQASISDLETGKSKAYKGTTLISVAQKLKVSPTWLETGKGSMDQLDAPLSPEALVLARDWMKLAPEVRASVHDMIRQMIKTSAAEQKAVPDEDVAAAYGRPGKGNKRQSAK